jgi:hypothetical protein
MYISNDSNVTLNNFGALQMSCAQIIVCMIDRQYSSYCFLASELSIKKTVKYSRQAANSKSMGLKFFLTYTSRSRSFITTTFHSSVHFFPVLVKGLYQTESYSLHVVQLIRI